MLICLAIPPLNERSEHFANFWLNSMISGRMPDASFVVHALALNFIRQVDAAIDFYERGAEAVHTFWGPSAAPDLRQALRAASYFESCCLRRRSRSGASPVFVTLRPRPLRLGLG